MSAPRITNVRMLEGASAAAWISRWWPALYDDDPYASAYQSPQWMTAWLRQLPMSDTPVAIVVVDEEGDRAALVLARHRTSTSTSLSVLTPYAEHNDLVGPGAQQPHFAHALAEYLEQLAQDGTSVGLTDVHDCSELAADLVGRAGWQVTSPRSALIRLPLDWKNLPSSLRSQHAKRERRVRAGHSITYARTRTTTELLHMRPGLERLCAARWTPAATPGPDWAAVLTALTDKTAFIASITIDGVLAAAQLCLHRGRTAWSLRPAMNRELGRLAPGHLLLHRLIDDLAADGFTDLDLGRTGESNGQVGYKEQYQPHWSATFTFTLSRQNAEVSQLASV